MEIQENTPRSNELKLSGLDNTVLADVCHNIIVPLTRDSET